MQKQGDYMANQQNTKSVFDEFTNKYSLSKTLRFELKPVGKTQQMLEDEDVFGKDRIRKEKYEQTKPYIDRLHRDFIVESLKGKTIEGLNEYLVALKNLQKNKNDANAKREFDKVSKKLRTQINNHFKTEKLFGKPGLIELKERYGQEEDSLLKNDEGEFELDKDGNKISIFDEWDRFLGYFDKFEATRKNFYKDDGAATAIATRIIDQNLRRFCENMQLFTSIKDKIDFREVARNFSANLEGVFSLDYYNSCMLQDGIDAYNKILGGETNKETSEKLKGLNEVINKYRQDNKGEKIAFFKLLDKQILSEKDKAFFEVIEDDKELLNKLNEFYVSAEEKTTSLKALLHDFFHNQQKYELDKIYFSKEALNTILYKWMGDGGREEFQQNIFEQTKKEKIVKFDKTDNSYTFSDFVSL
jgi:CRISPR-associated protein Cpf1